MNDNKLIYKNTVIIYVRMIIVTIVGLFSSRFVLQALGASDYGLYNVVGGLIAMLNFISTAMATTTRRFINVEMGKTDGNLNKVFNISLLLHIGFAIFILLVAETVGLWYIYNMMNVAEGKFNDAMFVFQISTIVACIGIINVPYQSLIEANEQFGKAAVIDILTTFVKFGLVLLLLIYSGNSLRFYAISICVVTLFSFVMYHGVCFRQWRDTIRVKWYGKSPLYKEILVFNNYTALGAAVSIGKSQGCNLLVNFFFGTVVNAAFALAYQVESYVYMFVNKLTLAANPQVAKNYAGDNLEYAFSIVERNARLCILIMIMFFFPLFSEMNFVLSVWLKEVPENASLFCSLTLIYALVMSFSEGTNGYIQASGKIKWFQIIGSSFTLLNLPLGFLLFKLGFEAFWIIVSVIVTAAIYRIVSLLMMKKLLSFNLERYVRNAFIPPFIVIAVMAFIIILYKLIPISSFPMHILGIASIFLIDAIVVFFIGLGKDERIAVLHFVQTRVKSLEGKG